MATIHNLTVHEVGNAGNTTSEVALTINSYGFACVNVLKKLLI